MLLYFANAATLITQTLGGIIATEFLDQIAGIACNISRKFNGIDALKYDVVCAHGIGAREGWSACKERERYRMITENKTIISLLSYPSAAQT